MHVINYSQTLLPWKKVQCVGHRKMSKKSEKRKVRAAEKMTSSAKKTCPSYQEIVDKFFCKKEENVVIDLT